MKGVKMRKGKEGAGSLDELDEKIIEELKKDARSSYRDLAKALKVSTMTIINRVRKLEGEGIIKGYSVNLDYVKLGYDFPALVEITIRKGALLEVQKKIAQLNGVVSVYDVTGASDSMVFCRVKTRAELSKLVKTVLAIPEVERSNTHVILNVIKEDYKALV